MKKELVICFVVILAIVVLNIVTENFTNNVTEDMTAKLNNIREKLLDSEHNVNQDMDAVIKEWDEEKEKLSCYIEHDELEKIELYLSEVNSYIEINNYSTAIKSLDSCNVILALVKDKYKLTLENIF